MVVAFNGDVKLVTKALTAIAYFNRGAGLNEVMESVKHFTQEQFQRWLRLNVVLYDQFTEDTYAFRPDGESYFSEEDQGDEGVKPF